MSNLDKKLDDLSIWIEANRDISAAKWEEVWPEIRTRFKQAFIDDGWVKSSNSKIFKSLEINGHLVLDGKELMTGQEWYDMFEKEVDAMNMQPPIIDGAYLDAARKASGIE